MSSSELNPNRNGADMSNKSDPDDLSNKSREDSINGSSPAPRKKRVTRKTSFASASTDEIQRIYKEQA